MFTECNLKNNFHQYETIVGLETNSNQSNQSNTRTMDEYEMDELRKNATKDAIEEAWLRTSDTLLTVEECVDSWREKTLADAVKMWAAKTKRDAALNDVAIKAKENWLNEQLEVATAMDSVVSLKDPKFLKYIAWLNENDTYNDLRYVMWSHREYCDNVEADDSKYDELPLHERYTWHSDDEDEEDEDSDLSLLPDLITEEDGEDIAAIKAKTIAETVASEFAADLADDYCVNMYDLKSLMLDEDSWDRWDVEKVVRLKHNISEYERVHLNGR
jgi:hypothetical protein